MNSINDEAFYGCTGLHSVTIGNSVTSINDEAFSGCTGLTSITIGNSVTNIGDYAFYRCTGLHSVTIGAGVQSIGNKAFSYPEYYDYGSIKPEKVIWLCNTPPEGYYEVQGRVNYVSNESYSGLSNMTVYPYLSSMFETGGIKYVPTSPSERTCVAIDCAYDETANNIYLGKTVTYNGIDMTLTDVGPYLCYDNDSVKSLVIDSYVGNLGHSAFYECNTMATAEFNNFNGSIGHSAFEKCSNLGGIVLPDGVTSIGGGTFAGCTAMAYATIGSGITRIPESRFSQCSSLPEITIPASVDSIKDGAFYGCTSLRNVIISDRTALLTLGKNDSDPLFSSCPLDSVYIGGNLSYPTESDKGYSPFYRNTSLRTVKITDKETEISENEFYGCTNLRNVSLGDGIDSIGNYAFSGCSALDKFTFGSSVKKIGEEAFSDCTAMTSLTSRTLVPPVCGPQALDDINKWTCQLYVPENAIEAYKSADQWKEFFFIQTGIGDIALPGDAATRILQGRVQVFNLSGQLQKTVEKAETVSDILDGLAPGVYILKGNGTSLKVSKN